MNSEAKNRTRLSTCRPKCVDSKMGILGDYEPDPAGLKVLQAACEAWDVAQGAREAVAADGLTVRDRFGQVRAHPLLAEERRQRESFVRAIVALGLDKADVPS